MAADSVANKLPANQWIFLLDGDDATIRDLSGRLDSDVCRIVMDGTFGYLVSSQIDSNAEHTIALRAAEELLHTLNGVGAVSIEGFKPLRTAVSSPSWTNGC